MANHETPAHRRVRVRVPVTRDQRRHVQQLTQQSGLSAAMHIRHAVLAYLEDPDRVRDAAWSDASQDRSDGVIAVRLPVALRDELAQVGARTGLTMATQFRVALAYAWHPGVAQQDLAEQPAPNGGAQ